MREEKREKVTPGSFLSIAPVEEKCYNRGRQPLFSDVPHRRRLPNQYQNDVKSGAYDRLVIMTFAFHGPTISNLCCFLQFICGTSTVRVTSSPGRRTLVLNRAATSCCNSESETKSPAPSKASRTSLSLCEITYKLAGFTFPSTEPAPKNKTLCSARLIFKPSKPESVISALRFDPRFHILYVSDGAILDMKGITELSKWKLISI
ncbi:hypothetical protein IEQ34_014283 [Dendrobium chrysotoxum]|uniref:Uncharacterized protein n=1 Tax=Dendrobium chrysotoxum TaxID=161865 RepID=A0AAV7GIK8_DENCH|nr:hypothetical protein IEQ34_014283 [Dendrobium chrysotoxum]